MLQDIGLAEFEHHVGKGVIVGFAEECLEGLGEHRFHVEIDRALGARRVGITEGAQQQAVEDDGQLIEQIAGAAQFHIAEHMLLQHVHADEVFMHDVLGRLARFDDGDLLMLDEHLGEGRRADLLVDRDDALDIGLVEPAPDLLLGGLGGLVFDFLFLLDIAFEKLDRVGHLETQVDIAQQARLIDHAETFREVGLNQPQQFHLEIGEQADLIEFAHLDQHRPVRPRQGIKTAIVPSSVADQHAGEVIPEGVVGIARRQHAERNQQQGVVVRPLFTPTFQHG